MPTEEPKVTICITNYNYGRFIGDAIQSVLEQTYKNFELIIMDNCSTDNSEEVIKSFSDSRIRFYKNDRTIHGIRNWNRCLSLARGEYIALLHADDKLTQNSVKGPSHTLEHLRAYNKASLEQQLAIHFSDIKTITVSEFDCEHLLSYCKNIESKTKIRGSENG